MAMSSLLLIQIALITNDLFFVVVEGYQHSIQEAITYRDVVILTANSTHTGEGPARRSFRTTINCEFLIDNAEQLKRPKIGA